jgi:hypothetical protein
MSESGHRSCKCGAVYDRSEHIVEARETSSFECAVCGKTSRIGTQLGCLDIGSLPVQLGMPNFPESDFLLALHRVQFCQESDPA